MEKVTLLNITIKSEDLIEVGRGKQHHLPVNIEIPGPCSDKLKMQIAEVANTLSGKFMDDLIGSINTAEETEALKNIQRERTRGQEKPNPNLESIQALIDALNHLNKK